MVRFVHTADWQIGLRVRFLPGDAGAVVRDARLKAVRAIGDLARERAAAFVIVAGDTFEHHGLKPDTLRKTFDALRAFPCSVYILPGNHDPLTADSLYRGKLWREAPPNVHVLDATEPVEAAPGAWLFPCPLRERHVLDDPTAHLAKTFGPQGVIRIGVAHGSVPEVLGGERAGEAPDDAEGEPRPNAIPLDTATRAGLDYLALGDWHSPFQIDARTWYSGAPEATRFKEKRPGHALLVEVDEPGALPRVAEVPVASLRWLQKEAALDRAEHVDALADWLEALPAKHDTLVELTLRGAPDGATHAAWLRHQSAFADRLRWLRVRDEALCPLLSPDDLDAIATAGWVRQTVDTLRARAEPRPPAPLDLAAGDALRLLYRLHAEEAL